MQIQSGDDILGCKHKHAGTSHQINIAMESSNFCFQKNLLGSFSMARLAIYNFCDIFYHVFGFGAYGNINNLMSVALVYQYLHFSLTDMNIYKFLSEW